MSRLRLNFDLSTNTERSLFITQYLQSPMFQSHPPTEDELDMMAKYILWGKDPESGRNIVQDKLASIPTKHGTWDAASETQSLEELLEQSTFNEAQLAPKPHYTTPHEVFSRDDVLSRSTPEKAAQFRALFRRIDTLDLQINFYELDHEKRTQIREHLLNKFNELEQAAARDEASHWSYYQYLKKRHYLVELRREQYTLRDSINTPILLHCSAPHYQEVPSLGWGEEIVVRPLGIKNEQSGKVFRAMEELNPKRTSSEDIEGIVRYYWEVHDKKDGKFVFDFRSEKCVYELFGALEEMRAVAGEESVEGNVGALLDTLGYYVKSAELMPMYQDILDGKIRGDRNQDIVKRVNEKYGKGYTENYMSTLFCKKIIPLITEAATIHEKMVENLPFSEEFKTCSCCGRTYLKSAQFFVRKARSSDGLNSKCKMCDKRDRAEKKVIKDGKI